MGENWETQQYIIQIRGLPYDCQQEKITEFLNIHPDNVEEIHMTCTVEGKPSGEAFLVINDEAAFEEAKKQHKQTMPDSDRYIDVYNASQKLMSKRITITWQWSSEWDGIVRIKNVPVDATIDEIKEFFTGLTILDDGIFLPTNKDNHTIGEAYVEFSTFSDGELALSKTTELLKENKLEITKSCNNEMRSSILLHRKLTHHATRWGDSKKYVPRTFQSTNDVNVQEQQEDVKQEVQSPGPTTHSQWLPVPQTQCFGSPEKKVKTEEEPQTLDNGVPIESPPAASSQYTKIITLRQVGPGTEPKDIQAFFRPARAVAVHIRADKSADVAFKSHEQALIGAKKHGQMLNGIEIQMILKSRP